MSAFPDLQTADQRTDVTNHSYHNGWSNEKVQRHIRPLDGTNFDPKAAEVFLKKMTLAVSNSME